jgi:hypothetical protein
MANAVVYYLVLPNWRAMYIEKEQMNRIMEQK